MEAIFNKSTLEFVNADVPDGYDQGQTHAGIEYVANGFNGYKYWLSASPYANYNLDWENPCVYYANERDGGLPPIDFTPHVQNPFQVRPGLSGVGREPFNSDPDIFYDGDTDKMLILNRICLGEDLTNGIAVGDIINYQEVVGLTGKTEPQVLYTPYEATVLGARYGILSPSLLKVDGKFRSYHLSSSGGSVNVKCYSLSIMESDSMDGRQFKRLPNGSIFGGNVEPWHIDVFRHESKFYAIVCASDWDAPQASKPLKLYLAESTNGFDFKIYKRPLISYESYRGSALVRPDGVFVLYATVVDTEFIQEPIYSVDGREILLGYMDFNELLGMLQTNE